MTLRYRVLVVMTLLCLLSNLAHSDTPRMAGVRTMTTIAPERGRPIEITLWYPAGGGGTFSLVGRNAVFEGVPARQDAAIADGEFPIVLLAHGGLRAAQYLGGWIASDLAARGFIVVITQPPRLGDRSAQAAVREVWLRPADLSAALTAIERDASLAGHIQADRVGALGFLLGGTSALALAGARIDPEHYMRSCDQEGTGLDCAWFAKNGVDLHESDPRRLARSNLDERIEVAIAIDPEQSASFTRASLMEMTVPVDIINLGKRETVAPGLDAEGLETLIPAGRYHRVPDATPFSSFDQCRLQGPDILRGEGEDEAICRDGGGRTRADIHAQLAEMIEAALARGFSREP